MLYTTENIKCFPLNRELLDASINAHFQSKLPVENTKYRLSGLDVALIKEPKLCIITQDFVGSDVDTFVTFDINMETKNTDGTTNTKCGVASLSFSISELGLYFMPEISLAEFTKERRGYNTRIKINETHWLRYFNTSEE